MKIAVIGSRDIEPEIEKIIKDIQKITQEKPIIISGGAKGAAQRMGWDYEEYRPN
jgi:predicted Rossmann fold nucleotide-binding protein DprA/Smf involved in DNA uptake